MRDEERTRAGRGGGAGSSTSRRYTDRPRSIAAAALSTGVGVLLVSGMLVAQDPAPCDESSDGSANGAAAPSGGMIPRDTLVDMTRTQSEIICSSEVFLGCMGFDGSTCLSLSESAIAQCLLPLPEEIDPKALDNATLEACPKRVYEKAGYDEEAANACFDKALEES